jgi:hypothetical protein
MTTMTTSKIKNEENHEDQNGNDNNHCRDALCNKKYKLINYYNPTIDKTYIRLDVNEEAVNKEIIENIIHDIINDIIVLEEYTNYTVMNIISTLNMNMDSESANKGKKNKGKKNKGKKNKSATSQGENKDEIPLKYKLNLDKIKNIVDTNTSINSNDESTKTDIKNISLYKIIKKINTKIQTELAKETINYLNLLKSYKKSNSNGDVGADDLKNKLSAIYYLILKKIDNL